MARVETNVFPIENLEELRSEYRLYRIRGLAPDHAEFHQNREAIKRALSYQLRTPATIIEQDGESLLVVRDDSPEPPSPFAVVRARVRFEPVPGRLLLDYTTRSQQNDTICIRFIDFVLHASLHSQSGLWSPGAGQPYFLKQPDRVRDGIGQHRGFSLRAAFTHDGRIGVSVDVTFKYVGANPLPQRASRDQFAEWKGRRFVYRYGHDWFDITLAGLSDLTAGETEILLGGEYVNLIDFIVRNSRKPLPPELAALSADTGVGLYLNNRGEQRAAPLSLCYRTYGTDDEAASHLHPETILPPHQRRRMAQEFVNANLRRVRFGNQVLRVAPKPVAATEHMFVVPDVEFGRSAVLSVRGTTGARQTTLERLGKERLSLLQDRDAGFFDRQPLDRQYLILPRSVADSFGSVFIADLKRAVNALFRPDEGTYEPEIITYNDRVPKTYVHQGREILAAVRAARTQAGAALVMIHHTTDRRLRAEDQLGAMVVRKLNKLDLRASVIHSAMGLECYEAVESSQGMRYRVRANRQSAFGGYMRQVALSKVLLTNQRWPYVLANPLHADVTVGVDVKNHIVGFAVVGARGRRVRWDFRTSKQAEHLLREEAQAHLLAVLRDEHRFGGPSATTIVIHRDGRMFGPELAGFQDALERLKDENIVSPNATLTVLEIPKSAAMALRLFEVRRTDDGRTWVENPEVGRCYFVGENAYLCSTGRSFLGQGTVRPLHVQRLAGPLSLVDALEDLYGLTVLGSWTSPGRCTRDPITVRLNDRLLTSEAAAYDEQALAIQEVLSVAEVVNE